MARAGYVYLVRFDGEPLAAFTVKYEMENWIYNNWVPEWTEDRLTLWSFEDGLWKRRGPVQMRMVTTKQLNQVGED